MFRAILLFSVFSVTGCASGISLMPYQDKNATPLSFDVCHGFGCSYKTPVTLSSKHWEAVKKPLEIRASDAAQERDRITMSVALMEQKVQEVTQMNADMAEARTFEKDQHQMDCLDETINTSRYLAFLEAEKLLHFHETANPVHRGFFIDGKWPHNSAAIKEKETGAVYVIDSYYTDNGGKVYSIDLKTWRAHWQP